MKMSAKKVHPSGPKNKLHKLLLKAKNKEDPSDEKTHIVSFFKMIKTGLKYEADTLAHELTDVSVRFIHCFVHKN